MDRARRALRRGSGLIAPPPTATRADATGAEPPGPDRDGGLLRLVFAPGARGTRIAEQASRAPLRVHRPFSLGGGEALVQLVHIGPGLLAGDRVEIDLVVRSGARAVIVAQSATKLHSMEPGETARQRVRLRVERGGRLEVHAGLLIPFPGGAFEQEVDLDLAAGASLAWLERWTTGRARAGERGRFRRLASRLRLRVDGEPRYADALELRGHGPVDALELRGHGPADALELRGRGDPDGTGDFAATGLLGGRRCLAAGVFVGGGAPPPADGADGIAVGPFDADIGGHYLRALADDPLELRRAVAAAANARRVAEGRAALAFDRYGS